MVAWIAPAVSLASPQVCPEWTYQRPADQKCDYGSVQQERASQPSAEGVVPDGDAGAAGCQFSCHKRSFWPLASSSYLAKAHAAYFSAVSPAGVDSSGWVTMLMFVMPACLTASITEAKRLKGYASVGADVDDALGGIGPAQSCAVAR